MKTFFNKKIIAKLTILMLLFSITLYPNRTHALFGLGDIVLDPTNLVQTTATAVSSAASAASQYSVQLKEYVLDPLASGLAKQVIRQLTNSVVNWINSGFEGSPSFVQNPGSFFLDVADQITGDFLAKTGGPLTNLCSPFSIDIRIALAFKYRPRTLQRYTCTLGTIIQNSKGAVENASINGFTAGDFRQGGWPAFISMTTEPQNNPYSAYLSAESELSWRVGNAQAQQRDELGAGQGFLSWRDPKCIAKVKAHQKNVATIKDEDDYLSRASEFENTPRTNLDCPVLTPGKVIAGSLQANLDGPLQELQLADEISEIVNALFAQLVTQVLQKGLSTVSTKDASGTSYLDQTVSELNQEANPQFQSVKAELLKNTDTYKKNTAEYKQARDEALNIMLDIKNNYDTAKSCFETKAANENSFRGGVRDIALSEISLINSTLTTRVANKALSLLTLAQDADVRLKTLQDIQTATNNAKTLNDLNLPSQKYSQLVQSNTLTSAIDIQNAKADLTVVQSETADLKQDALRKIQKCQALTIN